MRRTFKKLSLDTTTIRTLDDRALASAGGGSIGYPAPLTFACQLQSIKPTTAGTLAFCGPFPSAVCTG